MQFKYGPRLSAACLFLVTACVTLFAQTPSRLVTTPIDESKLVTLHGNVHPLAQARYDLGSVSDSTPTGRLLLLLNRPDDQNAALDQHLKDVHTSGSAAYHQWIAPQQFGARFGPAESDIQAVSSWLSAKGFQIARVSKGETLIEFSGVIGQVNVAFHTEIHRYEVNGELHYANATDPEIPLALSGIIGGISALHDFHAKPAIRLAGRARLDPETKKITPELTLTGSNGTFYGVGPEDFATQYDLAPLYATGINGSGKTIGIINDSNIDVSLDNAYRTLFGLSGSSPQIVVDGGDPGVNADETEAYLDVELAGAVAPGATIDLYIASFDTLDDPLILAAQRAVEDNQGDVLSISFGNCEANLGTGDNQILSSLWQQAAAQGQTVLVSAGDNGSDGCDNPSGRAESISGFGVNGFASTEWDVAVGGTDFYYSDYASGAPSAATLWNATNDANYGSLKASLPEQVWNDWFGFDAAPAETIYAGSGGVSTIYSKPAWQTGSGVPNDSHRDLPDISLFSGDGTNLSGYVICANPGDCTPESGGLIPVSIVGGTSASAQAMAGIMALVDQKYGRQGQANFVLYPLVRQASSAFHDITLGGNNVPCMQGTPDCVLGTSGTDDGQYTLSGYPAGAGYDLASGLGSIDANVLVTNWNKITFLPTITTLQLSSSTFPHGTAVTFTADVTHASGSDSPTGNVAILTNSPVPFGQTQNVLPIGSNGSATGSIDTLPGGSYQLWASYAGDGIYSGGTSSPVAVNVTPENSSVAIWTIDPSQQSGMTITYGDAISFFAQPKGASSGLTTATGLVNFILDGQTAGTVALNVKGIASWNSPAGAGPGPHSATASYAGDASYNPSQSSPFTYTVNQEQPTMNFVPGGVCGSTGTGACTVYAGDTVPVEIQLNGFGALIPTGSVSVTLGSQSQTVTMTANGFAELHDLWGIADFSNLTPGTYQLSASYSGDVNYQAIPPTLGVPVMVVAPSGARVATTTTISESSPTVSYPFGTMGGFNVTVTGGSGSSGSPTGYVSVYTNGLGVDNISLAPSGPNSATGYSGPQVGDYFNLGLNQISAVYTGDGTYQESVSAPITLMAVEAGTTPDFTLAPATPQFVVPKGGSANTSVNLIPIFGFNSSVNLSCTTSSTAIGCSVSPTSVQVNGDAAVTLTVNSVATATMVGVMPGTSGSTLWPAATMLLGSCLLAGFSRAHRRRTVLAAMTASMLLFVACGGGGQTTQHITPPPPQPPNPLTTYTVVVSATANGVIHNATVIVSVQ